MGFQLVIATQNLLYNRRFCFHTYNLITKIKVKLICITFFKIKLGCWILHQNIIVVRIQKLHGLMQGQQNIFARIPSGMHGVHQCLCYVLCPEIMHVKLHSRGLIKGEVSSLPIRSMRACCRPMPAAFFIRYYGLGAYRMCVQTKADGIKFLKWKN